jgi:hypothetical protein
MAGSKEIRNKIKSVRKHAQDHQAMEMVAASKMKRAQDRMRSARRMRRPHGRDHSATSRTQIRNIGIRFC